jgi:hypothetical protein
MRPLSSTLISCIGVNVVKYALLTSSTTCDCRINGNVVANRLGVSPSNNCNQHMLDPLHMSTQDNLHCLQF